MAACIRAEEYEEATTLLIRFGEGFQNSKNYANQAKCYLGAIVVFLYGGMPQRAWELYQEASCLNSELGQMIAAFFIFFGKMYFFLSNSVSYVIHLLYCLGFGDRALFRDDGGAGG